MNEISEYAPFRTLPKGSRLLLAFSGGVDSSVAAYLCKKAGYDVMAVNMRLLPDQPADVSEKALNAARKLDLDLTFLDLVHDFREKVMFQCWQVFANGKTPNPCALCNPIFKFGVLREYALSNGCAGMATGHYAKAVSTATGSTALLRGTDRAKDQSYFLFHLSQEQLNYSFFPLGAYTKQQIREIAASIGLPNADAPDSQDACFTPKDGTPLAESLRQMFHAPACKGNFIEAETGKILGEHIGIHAYTIGQRKGTGVAMGKPAYVRRIDANTKRIELTPNQELLMEHELVLPEIHWLAPEYAQMDSFTAEIQVRYRGKPASGTVFKKSDGTWYIKFDAPIRALTPGQAAVLYDGPRLIGGGWI